MLKENLLKTIKNNHMLREGDRVVVAFSGGGDSTALLNVLYELKGELGMELFACHLNHKLRGAESDEDARFCRETAARLSVPVYLKEMDVSKIASKRGLNVEEAGRKARLALYRRALRVFNANKVATAHHRDDQAETVIINLLRGSGETGLSGIAPVFDGWLVRPFIDCSRDAIEEYLREKKIAFRTDSSNSDTSILRNRIRLELLPLLKEKYNPHIAEALAQTAEIMRGCAELTGELADAFYKKIVTRRDGGITIERPVFSVLPVHLKRLLIRRAFSSTAGSGHRLTFDQVEEIILRGSWKEKEFRIDLPFGVRLEAADDEIRFVKSSGAVEETTDFEEAFEIPGTIHLASLNLTWKAEISDYKTCLEKRLLKDPHTGVFDAAKVARTIVIRSRRSGDRMQPLGLKGTKKLQDILVDRKIHVKNRDRIPVFTSGGEIFWIPGVVAGERFKAEPSSERIIVFMPVDE